MAIMFRGLFGRMGGALSYLLEGVQPNSVLINVGSPLEEFWKTVDLTQRALHDISPDDMLHIPKSLQ